MKKEIQQLIKELERVIQALKETAKLYEEKGLKETAFVLGGRIEAYTAIKRRLKQILKHQR